MEKEHKKKKFHYLHDVSPVLNAVSYRTILVEIGCFINRVDFILSGSIFPANLTPKR